MAGVDPFLMKKWEKAYHFFFDVKCKDNADWTNFYHITKNVKNIYGGDSEQFRLAHESMKILWDGLLSVGDTNKDKHIQLSEFVNLLAKSDPKHQPKWFSDYEKFVFKLWDVSDDKLLDICEYTDGMAAYGVNDAAGAFKKFAVDKAGKPVNVIKSEDFAKLWEDYFYSKDPNAPGNHIFGILE